MGIIYISHRLEELPRIAHRVTVLRDGAVVGTRPIAEISADEIIRMMIGRQVGEAHSNQRPADPTDEAVLTVRDLSGVGVERVSFALRRGEIVGLAGLEGQGQEAFLEALCGLRQPAAGRVSVEAGGERVAIAGFRQAVRHGVAYLARDRRANGIFPSLSILDNFGVVSMGRDLRLGFIDRRRQRA